MVVDEGYESLLKFIYMMQTRVVNEDVSPFCHHILLQIYQNIGLRHLTFSRVSGTKMNLMDSMNISISTIQQYVSGMQKYDVFHPSNLPSKLLGKPVVELEDIMPYVEFERSQYYQLMGQSMYYRAIIPLVVRDRQAGIIGILKTKEEGAFTKEEMFFLRKASPFISAMYKYSLERENPLFSTRATRTEDIIIRRAKTLGLTRRETEVALLIVKGFSNDQISEALSISNHTTKTHIENIYLKAGTNRRTALISLLMGIVSPA